VGRDVESLMQRIEKDEVARLCSKLIQFNTVNPPGNEAEMAEYVGAFLRDAGLAVELLPCGPNRTSVIGRLKGSGKAAPILFSGHLDTLTIGDEEWNHDPFGGEISHGRVWGRGGTDMKGGDVAMLIATKILAANQVPLRGDLILALSADEEARQAGAHTIAERLRDDQVQAVFIPEPTENEVLIAEKGALWLEITTYGKAGHISRLEEARNALLMMLPILTEFTQLSIPYKEHPLLGGMVRSVNMIQSGQKMNTIPDRCVATLEMRTVPGQAHGAIIAQIEQSILEVGKRSPIRDFRASVRMIHELQPVESSPQNPAIQRFLDIVAEATGTRPRPKGINYGTDACVLIPVLKAPFAICGPGSYNATAATDEWVDIDKMVDTTRIYLATAVEFLA